MYSSGMRTDRCSDHYYSLPTGSLHRALDNPAPKVCIREGLSTPLPRGQIE